MKNLRKILFLLSAIVFTTACENQLYLTPISGVSTTAYFTTPDQVKTGVINIYNGLQAVPLREFAMTEMRSDNTKTNLSEGDYAQLQNLAVQPTNSVITLYYSACYNVIFRCNLVLQYLNVVTVAADRTQYEAEARFSRGLSYFNLVRAFGGIPLIDKVLTPSETYTYGRATETDIYNFIIADLTFAKDNLTARAGVEEGRATLGAASALLAKVYLTNGRYTDAKPLLDGLIANTDYAMMAKYHDVFYTKRNKEIIFSIEYINDNPAESEDFSLEMTSKGVARGLNYPTNDFRAAVTPADLRIADLYNAKSPAEVGKYISSSVNATYGGNDWIVLRLADVLLMQAEAILAGNNATNDLTAIAAYNLIRNRAGLSQLPTDGTGTLTKQMLSDERRVELSFEDHRFYDLIRFGMAETVLSAFATASGFTFTPTALLLPIPQREINTSFGALAQNPGY